MPRGTVIQNVESDGTIHFSCQQFAQNFGFSIFEDELRCEVPSTLAPSTSPSEPLDTTMAVVSFAQTESTPSAGNPPEGPGRGRPESPSVDGPNAVNPSSPDGEVKKTQVQIVLHTLMPSRGWHF